MLHRSTIGGCRSLSSGSTISSSPCSCGAPCGCTARPRPNAHGGAWNCRGPLEPPCESSGSHRRRGHGQDLQSGGRLAAVAATARAAPRSHDSAPRTSEADMNVRVAYPPPQDDAQRAQVTAAMRLHLCVWPATRGAVGRPTDPEQLTQLIRRSSGMRHGRIAAQALRACRSHWNRPCTAKLIQACGQRAHKTETWLPPRRLGGQSFHAAPGCADRWRK